MTAAHVVQRPGPLVWPDVSGAHVVTAPLHPFGVSPTQQSPTEHEPPQHSSAGLAGQVLAPLPTQPPWFLGTQVPCTTPASKAAVTQMSALGHWLSSVHPPQKLGAEKPQVGDPPDVQSAEDVQLPGTQEPETHTNGFDDAP